MCSASFTVSPTPQRQLGRLQESARSAHKLNTSFLLCDTLQMALSEASLNADARKMNRASDSAASLANMSLKSNGAAHGKPERVQAPWRNPNMLPLLLEAASPAGRSRLMASDACGAAPGGP